MAEILDYASEQQQQQQQAAAGGDEFSWADNSSFSFHDINLAQFSVVDKIEIVIWIIFTIVSMVFLCQTYKCTCIWFRNRDVLRKRRYGKEKQK